MSLKPMLLKACSHESCLSISPLASAVVSELSRLLHTSSLLWTRAAVLSWKPCQGIGAVCCFCFTASICCWMSVGKSAKLMSVPAQQQQLCAALSSHHPCGGRLRLYSRAWLQTCCNLYAWYADSKDNCDTNGQQANGCFQCLHTGTCV